MLPKEILSEKIQQLEAQLQLSSEPTTQPEFHLSTTAQKNNRFGTASTFYLFRLLQSMRQSIRAIEQYSRKLSTQFDITAPQLICLSAIQEHQSVAINALSRQVHLSPNTVAGICNRLEKKGLLGRHTNSTNKRRGDLQLTDAGRQLLQEAPTPLQDRLANVFGTLPEEEQQTIVSSLEKIVDMINARDLHASPVLATGPLHCTPEIQNVFWESVETELNPKPEEKTASKKAQKPFNIRRATEDDKADIVQFINSSVEWYRGIIDEQDLPQHAVSEAWADENMQKREFFIAESEGQPVGTLSLQFFGEYTYLGYVYINASHVGNSFGKKLLQFAEAESRRRGMKGMVLIAHPQASWAITAYQKFGFRLLLRERDEILAWNNGALKPYYEEYFMLFQYDWT